MSYDSEQRKGDRLSLHDMFIIQTNTQFLRAGMNSQQNNRSKAKIFNSTFELCSSETNHEHTQVFKKIIFQQVKRALEEFGGKSIDFHKIRLKTNKGVLNLGTPKIISGLLKEI